MDLRQDILRIPAIFLAIIFFAIILVSNWLGYRLRKRVARMYPDMEVTSGAVEGSLLGLMALVIAFTFGSTMTKFESRRQLIIDEANVIDMAVLRCDLYPDSIKHWLLPDFKQYIETRIDYYNLGDNPTPVEIGKSLNDTRKSFAQIWNKTISLEKDERLKSLAEQMVPTLVYMRNIVGMREATRLSTVPFLIIIVLLMLVFASSFIIGFGVKPGHRHTVLSFVFAFMTSLVLFLIMEMSRPRQGFITIDSAERNMVELRNLFSKNSE